MGQRDDCMWLRGLLRKLGPNRFALDGANVWIGVGGLSVYVARTGEGVAVDIYRRETDDDPVSSTYAFFAEGEDGEEGSEPKVGP